MTKKFILLIILFQILLFCGCEINNLNNTKKPSKLTVSDIKQLIGISYDDIEKIYGPPEKSTYYLNTNILSSISNNHLTLRDFNHNSIIEAYYNIGNNDSYIMLWYKNNKVIESYFYENYINDKNYFDINSNNINLKIGYNKCSSVLGTDFDKNIYKNYIYTNIKNFNNKYSLNSPLITVNLLDKNTVLYFYNIENITNDSLFIVCNNNIIADIKIIKHSSICESIIEYIN